MNPLSWKSPFLSRPRLAWTVVLGLLSVLCSLAFYACLVRFVEEAWLGKGPGQGALYWLAGMLIITVAGQGLRFFYAREAASLGRLAAARLREYLWERLSQGPVRALRTGGEPVQAGPDQALRVADALEPWYGQYRPQALLAIGVPLLVLVLVYSQDPWSALVLAVTGPLLPLLLALIGIQAKARGEKQWQSLARLRAFFLESLVGLKTLKLLGLSAQRREELESAEKEFSKRTLAVLRTAFLSALVLEWAAALGTALVAVQVALRLQYGQLEFGAGLFALLCTPEFYKPIRQYGLAFHTALDARNAYKQQGHWFKSPEAPVIQAECAPLPKSWSLRLSTGSEEMLAPGAPLVLTGPSGCGKTTLLLDFLGEGPGTGKCVLGPPTPWESIAWMPQQPVCWKASLRENLDPHGKHADRALWDALEAVGLAQRVRALPGGLDGMVEEGGRNFSGGERRRLALSPRAAAGQALVASG